MEEHVRPEPAGGEVTKDVKDRQGKDDREQQAQELWKCSRKRVSVLVGLTSPREKTGVEGD
jgi:hypothetical protein